MKKTRLLVPVLSAALIVTALPGNMNRAKADDQTGNIEEILLVKNTDADSEEELQEVFHTYLAEDEKSEALKEEALEELTESSDTAILIFGKNIEDQTEEEMEEEQSAISQEQQEMIGQVADKFQQVVVIFNNFRPYGLEIMNDYASIKTVTMLEAADDVELMETAAYLYQIMNPESQLSEDEVESETQTEEEPLESDGEADQETTESETESETETEEKVKGKVTITDKKKTTNSKYADRPLGDVNGDGVVDTLDATILMQQKGKKLTKELLTYGDVDGDNKITNRDVKMILKYASEEITEFEAEK